MALFISIFKLIWLFNILTFRKHKGKNKIIKFNINSNNNKKSINKLKKLSKLKKIFKFKKLLKNWNLSKNNTIKKPNILIFDIKKTFNHLW